MGNGSFIPLPGHIKIAITTPVFLHIRFPIRARADNVLVVITISRGEAARATHIPITFLVHQKGLKEFKYVFLIIAEIIALRLLGFFEHLI
jgi:hypothetical protein